MSDFVVIAAGGISATLGLVVLVGWYTHNVTLVQVMPIFVPMQYNTALGFLLCGVGLLSVGFQRPRLAIACGGLAGAVGLLTLTQYVLGLDFAIDQLLMEHYITVKSSHPGRMAPNTALSFLLTGAAVLILARPTRRKQPSFIAGLLGSIIVALGAVAFSGYMSGIETAYGWGQLTRMAVHTAAGFVVLGVGVLAFAWREGTAEETAMPRWLAIPVALGVATVSVALWQALAAQDRSQIRVATEIQADNLGVEINGLMEPKIMALVRMAKRWESHHPGRISKGEWEVDAAFYVEDYLEYQAIEWVDSSFHVRWIMPLEGNEAALDLDLAFEERQRMALQAARDRREVTVTPLIEVPPDDKRLPVHIPLFMGDNFDGFIRGVFHVQELLEPVLSKYISRGYLIAIFDGEGEFYRHDNSSGQHEAEWAEETEIELYNVTWHVRVWPGPETLAEARSFLPELALGAGFLMAFLLALTVHLAQTARLRSRELGLSNQELVKVIAERKRAEETLKKAHAELQSLNAELEAFTYSVSHDLQAPLRHINGFSKMLVEEFGPRLDSAAQYYVQRIQEGSQQMGQLVDDVLNLRRLGRQKLYRQVTGLNSLVEEVLRNLQPEVEGRQIEWQIGRLPLVDCDPALMKQVFANLLSNALKFTRLRERAVIEVSTMKQEGQPVVFVRDNGVGFSMKYADKLFGVFQRLHRQEDFEGTGVGLATVQRILHKHGGRAWAQAELDKGATFYFTLGTAKNSGTEDTSTAIERR